MRDGPIDLAGGSRARGGLPVDGATDIDTLVDDRLFAGGYWGALCKDRGKSLNGHAGVAMEFAVESGRSDGAIGGVMRIRHLLLGVFALTAGAAYAQSLPAVELLPPADISVTLDDGLETVNPGQMVTWTVTVNNVGINGLSGVLLTTALSRDLNQISWTCRATTGSQCTANGIGAPNDSVVIASRGSVSYRMKATVSSDSSGTVSVSISAATPSGYIDLTPENNRATDTDVVVVDAIFTDGFDP